MSVASGPSCLHEDQGGFKDYLRVLLWHIQAPCQCWDVDKACTSWGLRRAAAERPVLDGEGSAVLCERYESSHLFPSTSPAARSCSRAWDSDAVESMCCSQEAIGIEPYSITTRRIAN